MYVGDTASGVVLESLGPSPARIDFPFRVISADNLNQHPGAANAVDLSGNGRWIAFSSPSADLVGGDTNGVEDTFTRSIGVEHQPGS